MKAVSLLSGGLDSATATAQALSDGYEVIALSFRYGQRHEKELEAAKAIVQHFNIAEHYIVDINLSLWGGSALTDSAIDVPNKGLSNGIPVTYVPGRNTVFLSIALSLSEAKEASAIYLGINAVDYSGYPDCRPEYLEVFKLLSRYASKAGLEGNAPQLVAPLVNDSKVDIVRRAIRLGVPIDQTWSCYQGNDNPCRVCDSCRIREHAIEEVLVKV